MDEQKTIDLHGCNESEALRKMIMALYELDSDDMIDSLNIIIGKGEVLPYVVIEYLEQQNYDWDYDGNNYGAIIVFKKTVIF